MVSSPLPGAFATKIRSLFQRKIAETLHPPAAWKTDERCVRTDGLDYSSIMRLEGRGLVTAKGEPGEPKTFVWRMVDFVFKLDEYAKGRASLDELEKSWRVSNKER